MVKLHQDKTKEANRYFCFFPICDFLNKQSNKRIDSNKINEI